MSNLNVSSPQPFQSLVAQVAPPKIDQAQFAEWKKTALQDQKIDRDEASFLIDQLGRDRFDSAVIDDVKQLLSSGYRAYTANPVANIGGNQLTKIYKVDASFDLESARKITDANGIDEVYFQTVNSKGELGKDLYVAYGPQESRGALNLERIKPGYVGRMGQQKIKVVHINNETNTALEGAKAPWISTATTLRDAGQSGISKGLTEVATTVTALFIGKSVVESGVKTVTEGAAAGAAAGGAVREVTRQAPQLLNQARTFGATVGQSVKGSLKSVVVAGAVATAVVGTVVTVGSVIGAVKSRSNHRDYTTLDMVTGNY
jgi:hypothetical protein